MTVRIFVALLLMSVAGSAWAVSTAQQDEPLHGVSGPAPTEREWAAEFPADLGRETVDIEDYPRYLQESYDFFRQACTVCHSTARALNSPLTTHADWKTYVRKMHLKAKGQLLSDEDARRIVDFLVYDSYERKVKRKRGFEREQAQLKARFDEIQSQKARMKH